MYYLIKLIHYRDKQYEKLKKNVMLHLCYLYLIIYDYPNAIKTANQLKKYPNLSGQTR